MIFVIDFGSLPLLNTVHRLLYWWNRFVGRCLHWLIWLFALRGSSPPCSVQVDETVTDGQSSFTLTGADRQSHKDTDAATVGFCKLLLNSAFTRSLWMMLHLRGAVYSINRSVMILSCRQVGFVPSQLLHKRLWPRWSHWSFHFEMKPQNKKKENIGSSSRYDSCSCRSVAGYWPRMLPNNCFSLSAALKLLHRRVDSATSNYCLLKQMISFKLGLHE